MNLHKLQLFAEVAQRLNFTEVANDRGINASSVSRAIKELESELGVLLLQRNTRQMRLSEQGALFYSRLLPILDQFEALNESLLKSGDQAKGTLRVTCSMAFGQAVLLPLLPTFLHSHPELKLDLLTNDEQVDLVRHGIDLALRMAYPSQSGLVARKLATTSYSVYASPELTQTLQKKLGQLNKPSQLNEVDCIHYALPAFKPIWWFRRRDHNKQIFSVSIQTKIAISSPLSVLKACEQGLGVSVLADWLAKDALQHNRVVKLLPNFRVSLSDNFDHGIWAVYPNRQHLPSKVRIVLDYLAANIN